MITKTMAAVVAAIIITMLKVETMKKTERNTLHRLVSAFS